MYRRIFTIPRRLSDASVGTALLNRNRRFRIETSAVSCCMLTMNCHDIVMRWPAVDMERVHRELDEHADQLEMQERINTAGNLPVGPNEWQHDHAGKDLLHTQL